jgi:hypothetical protein
MSLPTDLSESTQELPTKKRNKLYTCEFVTAEYKKRDVENNLMADVYPDKATKMRWTCHFRKLGLPMKKIQKPIPVKLPKQKLPRKQNTKQYTDEFIIAEYTSMDVKNRRMVDIYPDWNTKAKWAGYFLKLGLPMKKKRGETPEEVRAYHRRHMCDWQRNNPELCKIYRDRSTVNRARRLLASGLIVPVKTEKYQPAEESPPTMDLGPLPEKLEK